jgi:hypothetical protein
MGANVFPTPFSGIQETIVDAKGDLVAATAADAPARLAVGTTEHRLVAASGEATGLKYVADTTNYAVAAKGDLLVGTAADTLAALTVGANGTTLVADSSTATGLKWDTPAAGGMTLLETLTLSGASVTSSTISGDYVDLRIYVENFKPASNDQNMQMRINSDSNARYNSTNFMPNTSNAGFTETEFNIALSQSNSVAQGLSVVTLYRYASTGIWKCGESRMLTNNSTTGTNYEFNNYKYAYNQTGAITTLFFRCSSGNFTSGTVYIYGVK